MTVRHALFLAVATTLAQPCFSQISGGTISIRSISPPPGMIIVPAVPGGTGSFTLAPTPAVPGGTGSSSSGSSNPLGGAGFDAAKNPAIQDDQATTSPNRRKGVLPDIPGTKIASKPCWQPSRMQSSARTKRGPTWMSTRVVPTSFCCPPQITSGNTWRAFISVRGLQVVLHRASTLDSKNRIEWLAPPVRLLYPAMYHSHGIPNCNKSNDCCSHLELDWQAKYPNTFLTS